MDQHDIMTQQLFLVLYAVDVLHMEEIQKIVTKALIKDSMSNKEPEQTVSVTFELEQDIFMALAVEAHKRDMKFNDLVIEIIQEYMNKVSSEEEQKT